MSNQTLRDELSNDPLNRGYSSMTDQEVATDLNSEYRTRNLDSIPGSVLWNNTDYAEFSNLSEAKQDKWLNLCGVDSVDPYGPAVDLATDVFSQGSTTLSNLADARDVLITRAEELGLGEVQPYDIEKARDQQGVS